jgi:hypothetical protein
VHKTEAIYLLRLSSGWAGAEVFAISLTLPVAKENRTVSHRTLPVLFRQPFNHIV